MRDFTGRWLVFWGFLCLATSCGWGGQDETNSLSGEDLRIPATDAGLPGAGPLRRYDWFQDLWLKRRTAWSQEIEDKQNALVFYGDSITQGWDSLARDFSGVTVANRGISGDTTRGLLVRLEGDVLALHPCGVVLLIGTNDLEEGAAPVVIASNLRLLLEELRGHRETLPVIVCQVFPASDKVKRPSAAIREINRLYHEVAADFGNVTVLDTWTLFANPEGDAKPEEFPDLLHPNEAGYVKWAAALRLVLETRELIPVTTDQTWQPEAGFERLFNGEDLAGWGYRPTSEAMKRQAANWRRNDPDAPPWPIVTKAETFDGERESSDGRYVARHGRLIVATPREGRKIQQLWTTSEFGEDFTLKLEFRATPNADSGVFLRGKQLQVRDYHLAGPYRELEAYRPQDWNELLVRVEGRRAHATVNGEVIESAFEIPESGPIGLEGDRGQMEYRRIRLRVDGDR